MSYKFLFITALTVMMHCVMSKTANYWFNLAALFCHNSIYRHRIQQPSRNLMHMFNAVNTTITPLLFDTKIKTNRWNDYM